MKTLSLSRLLPAFLPLCCLLLSCGDSSGTGPPVEEEPGPATMVVAPEEVTLNALGETVQFTATVWDPEGRVLNDTPLNWYSSDEAVAVISESGLVTAVGDGTATILAAAAATVFGWGDVTVTAKPLRIVTSSLRPGVVGLPYSQTLKAEGATTPIWAISKGSLPAGLTLDGVTGIISGTPVAPGESYPTVQLSDGERSLTKDFVVAVIQQERGIGFGEEEFSLIPAGSFLMGSEDSYSMEKPVHTVNITEPFMMQKTEVTQYQWATIMDGNPSGWKNCGDLCPVETVSWEETQLFLQRLNEADPGKNYRLPTEAQWEYAARAGTTGDFGGTGDGEEMGWFSSNSFSRTHVVAQKAPNAWGLFDMHGNVGEWVQDWFSVSYYAVSPKDDPTGPGTGPGKVIRGGNCTFDPSRGTSWRRSWTYVYKIEATIGFRLVRDP